MMPLISGTPSFSTSYQVSSICTTSSGVQREIGAWQPEELEVYDHIDASFYGLELPWIVWV